MCALQAVASGGVINWLSVNREGLQLKIRRIKTKKNKVNNTLRHFNDRSNSMFEYFQQTTSAAYLNPYTPMNLEQNDIA